MDMSEANLIHLAWVTFLSNDTDFNHLRDEAGVLIPDLTHEVGEMMLKVCSSAHNGHVRVYHLHMALSL